MKTRVEIKIHGKQQPLWDIISLFDYFTQIYQVCYRTGEDGRLVPSLQKGLLTPENLTISCSVFSSWQYSQNVTMQWSFL